MEDVLPTCGTGGLLAGKHYGMCPATSKGLAVEVPLSLGV